MPRPTPQITSSYPEPFGSGYPANTENANYPTQKRVVTIGGGITGHYIARHLQKPGIRSGLVEAGLISQTKQGEAIGHNGAFYPSEPDLARLLNTHRKQLVDAVSALDAVIEPESIYTFLDDSAAEEWLRKCEEANIAVRGGQRDILMGDRRRIFFTEEPLIDTAALLSHMSRRIRPIIDHAERVEINGDRVCGIFLRKNGFIRCDCVVLATGCYLNDILQRSGIDTVRWLETPKSRSLIFHNLPFSGVGVYRLLDEGVDRKGVSIVAKGHSVIFSPHSLELNDTDFLEYVRENFVRRMLPGLAKYPSEIKKAMKAEIVLNKGYNGRSRWAGPALISFQARGGPEGLYAALPGKLTLAPWFGEKVADRVAFYLKFGYLPGNDFDDGLWVPGFPHARITDLYG